MSALGRRLVNHLAAGELELDLHAGMDREASASTRIRRTRFGLKPSIEASDVVQTRT
jgi:hypothetical protein